MQKLAAVVDDNPNSRITAVRTLTKAHYKVTPFATIREFTERWTPGSVDLIVSDWHLGPTDRGDNLFHQVRKTDWEVPLILISGQLSDQEQRLDVVMRLLESGNTRFVPRGNNAFGKIKSLAEELQSKRSELLLHILQNHRITSNEKLPVSGGMAAPSTLEKVLASNIYFRTFSDELLRDLVSNVIKEEDE